jgi:hypothetical protein
MIRSSVVESLVSPHLRAESISVSGLVFRPIYGAAFGLGVVTPLASGNLA